MKKICLIACTFLLTLHANAQFRLKGSILKYNKAETLKINIPIVYGFYRDNNITIPVDDQGNFDIVLPVTDKKFGKLIFQEKSFLYLLSPGKSLEVIGNAADTLMRPVKGTSLRENQLMDAITLVETPFFTINESLYNDPVTVKDIEDKVIQPYLKLQGKKIEQVAQSSASDADKALIGSEIKYLTINYLTTFARTAIKNQALISPVILKIYESETAAPSVFPAGPQYYYFADNYLRYLEIKAFIQIKEEKIPESSPIPYYGISLDSATKIVHNYGKPYWRWIGATKNLPMPVVAQYVYQQLINLFKDKELSYLEPLSKAYINQFPTSAYNKEILDMVATLKDTYAQNKHNPNIQIIDGFEKISSIYDVVKPFRGKVVYLDVWGTWCGPCKEELKQVPALKSYFKDKDVVFVYLDMDEEDKDADWRTFIKMHKIEGLHLRKNRKTIDPFWEELLADAEDKTQYYPQYFIFNKEGKLVVSKALRPSNTEKLYEQINSILNTP